MRNLFLFRRWAPAVLVLLASGLPALAAVEAGGQIFEVWVENYSPGPSELDSDIAYGLRFSYNTSERITASAELGYVSTSGEFSDGLSQVSLDYSVWFVDFLADFNFAAGSKVVPALFVGAGFAGESADAKGSGPLVDVTVDGLDDAGLTLQAGGALKIQLGQKFDLRPGVRFRWFEARAQDETDTEYLLGFGYRF